MTDPSVFYERAALEARMADLGVPRETSPLEELNGGWPFGPGPGRWQFTIRWQHGTPTGSQPEGPHLVCAACGQSITRLGQWAHSWESLKPQVALHVMQVHSGTLAG